MNNEEMNIHVGAFAWASVCISLGYTPRSETAESHGNSCLTFSETCQTVVFQVTVPFYIPTSNAWGEDNWRETIARKSLAGCLCREQLTSSARWQAVPLPTGITHSRAQGSGSERRGGLVGICFLFFPAHLDPSLVQGKEAAFFIHR